jgi:hypothetical protein
MGFIMKKIIGLFKCLSCNKRIDEKGICHDCLLLACKTLNPCENDWSD